MNVRRSINDLLARIGYRVVRSKTELSHDIARGRYDWLRKRGLATVLDIGANTGQFATKIRKILPSATIHAFEPVHDSFEQLRQSSATLAPIVCHPFALGDHDGITTIHRNRESASSSVLAVTRRHEASFPEAVAVADETIDVRRLDTIAPTLELRTPILLKIDVQGYELSVLSGARQTLAGVEMAIIETSMVTLYEDQPLFDGVYRFMLGQGFQYAGCFDQVRDPATWEVLQEDSMFVREGRRP